MSSDKNPIKETLNLFKLGNMPPKSLFNSKSQDHGASRKGLTLGQRSADLLTHWAGSWAFILLFIFFLIVWMLINAYFIFNWGKEPFDKYPFILLNLILSCLAALQAPIILMSQNRSVERDRLRVEYDYAVNRKAEREIRGLQKKLEELKTILDKKK
ncbi:hypothetical protein CMI46_00560 [Candidatus Pacearchaeota archaeon]|nr:hypothetical protein [Candidatus Pacearchaeota archaeon]|tara:strand:- start:1197 stop:1667 length:471 start_codon:yes stop_codon:yes gene_type:complete